MSTPSAMPTPSSQPTIAITIEPASAPESSWHDAWGSWMDIAMGLGAIVAAIYAVKQWRKSIAETKQAQAARVAAWLIRGSGGSGDLSDSTSSVVVKNDSEMPIYDVIAFSEHPSSSRGVQVIVSHLGMIQPKTTKELPIDQPMAHAAVLGPAVQLYFVDAASQPWRRGFDGSLKPNRHRTSVGVYTVRGASGGSARKLLAYLRSRGKPDWEDIGSRVASRDGTS